MEAKRRRCVPKIFIGRTQMPLIRPIHLGCLYISLQEQE